MTTGLRGVAAAISGPPVIWIGPVVMKGVGQSLGEGGGGGDFRTPARDLAAVPAKIHQEHGVEIAIGERRGNQITKKSSHDLNR